tara:strand:+ start:6674 stop:7114 length:441 start_codon:yes stop_codon:yes gene_type:complete
MISEIIKEKTSADHLLYVSLKYTKTCDVILNLLARWKSMMELSFDCVIDELIKKKKIPKKPKSPKERIEFMKKCFKKYPAIQEAIPLYVFFKRVPDLDKQRGGEFRKNVNLKIIEPRKETEINMEMLGIYAEVLERFISEVKQILS